MKKIAENGWSFQNLWLMFSCDLQILALKSTLKKTIYPIDDHVSKAFLSAMVGLVGGYRNALKFKPVSLC
jgi:hypothetical protein